MSAAITPIIIQTGAEIAAIAPQTAIAAGTSIELHNTQSAANPAWNAGIRNHNPATAVMTPVIAQTRITRELTTFGFSVINCPSPTINGVIASISAFFAGCNDSPKATFNCICAAFALASVPA